MQIQTCNHDYTYRNSIFSTSSGLLLSVIMIYCATRNEMGLVKDNVSGRREPIRVIILTVSEVSSFFLSLNLLQKLLPAFILLTFRFICSNSSEMACSFHDFRHISIQLLTHGF